MDETSFDIGPFWELRRGPGSLTGMQRHADHNLRSEIVPLLAIDEAGRFVVFEFHSYNHRRAGF